MDISKKDWKLFRERLSGWQENYMEGLVSKDIKFFFSFKQLKYKVGFKFSTEISS